MSRLSNRGGSSHFRCPFPLAMGLVRTFLEDPLYVARSRATPVLRECPRALVATSRSWLASETGEKLACHSAAEEAGPRPAQQQARAKYITMAQLATQILRIAEACSASVLSRLPGLWLSVLLRHRRYSPSTKVLPASCNGGGFRAADSPCLGGIITSYYHAFSLPHKGPASLIASGVLGRGLVGIILRKAACDT